MSEERKSPGAEKYGKEPTTRHYGGPGRWTVAALCVLFSLIQLYAVLTANIPATQLRPLHLGFVMTLVFLIYPARRASRCDQLPWHDLLLTLLAIGCSLYIVAQHVAIANRISSRTTLAFTRSMDLIIGGGIILLLFECCRRVVGMPLMILTGAFVVYAYFGRYMPGFLAHRGFSLERLITSLVYSTEGIMGMPLGASSTFIFLFVLLGAFLERAQVGRFFFDLANSVTGHRRGGAARAAVFASALKSMVSGNAVAGTADSGSFTIPMMKELGYRPEFAAAVEASASTGGQIMPPIMGAAAFLMAESVGVPYLEVVKAAIVPALLYFAGINIIVGLEARKYGLAGMEKAKLPRLAHLLRTKGVLILPLPVVVGFLIAGYAPTFAALAGIVSVALCDLLRHLLAAGTAAKPCGADRPNKPALLAVRKTGRDILASLDSGARGALSVAVACGMAGIIVGTITLTGFGLDLGTELSRLAGGNTLLSLMLTMVASLILGMGVPTTANYLITSTIMAGTVMKALGCQMLTAHMFVFYFGIIANITPPFAPASMAGAAIAKSNPLRTGLNSVKLAIAAFLVPYLFAYNEKLLFIGAQWYDIVRMSLTAIVGMIGIGAAVEGYHTRHAHPIQRLIYLAGGLLLIDPSLLTDLVGIGLIALAVLWQAAENKRLGGRLQPSMDVYAGMPLPRKLRFMATESFVMLGRLLKKKDATA